MSTLLKDYFTPEFIQIIGDRSSSLFKGFNSEVFNKEVLNEEWLDFELKERYHHLASCLRRQLDKDYSKAVKQLVELSNSFKDQKLKGMQDLVYMFLPAVIEDYGGEDFKNSVWAMEHVTQLISCEFAIRQFFILQENEMLKIAKQWTQHKSEHVRRLASEGCRPALPWGKALNSFKKNPNPILPILETLKDDDSLFVRKSVANNLNDISKTHPEIVIKTVKEWYGKSEKTDWIIKHSCRTLLKQGNGDVLPLFGFFPPIKIESENFTVPPNINEGDDLNFSFLIRNKAGEKRKLRIEYAVYFLRKNGEHNHKVFMVSEKEFEPNEEISFNKKYSFKHISTRKYYLGTHYISLIINGIEQKRKVFNLT